MKNQDPFGWSGVPGHPLWEETEVLGQRYSCPTGLGCILGALVLGAGTALLVSQVAPWNVGMAWGLVAARIPFKVRFWVHDAWAKASLLAERRRAAEEGFRTW